MLYADGQKTINQITQEVRPATVQCLSVSALCMQRWVNLHRCRQSICHGTFSVSPKNVSVSISDAQKWNVVMLSTFATVQRDDIGEIVSTAVLCSCADSGALFYYVLSNEIALNNTILHFTLMMFLFYFLVM